MAKTPVNTGLEAVSGRIGAWVYRVLEGETVIAARPKIDPTREVTDDQKSVRENFRRGALFAKAVFADPARKLAYQQLALRRGVSAARLFAFVVQDYAKPPEITEVKVDAYHRQAGDPIDVFAKDDGEVMQVTVVLKNALGVVIEEGAAVLSDAAWRYVATTTVPPGDPITVVVTAKDRATRVSTHSVVAG
jgi:hypothetical protein